MCEKGLVNLKSKYILFVITVIVSILLSSSKILAIEVLNNNELRGLLNKSENTNFIITKENNQLPCLESYSDLKNLLESNKKILDDEALLTNREEADNLNSNEFEDVLSEDIYSSIKIKTDKTYEEADTIKTDGEYIYKIYKGKVEIIKAYPTENMKVVNTIDFEEKNFSPIELLLDNNNLIVIGKYTYKDISKVVWDGNNEEKILENDAPEENDSLIDENLKFFTPIYNKKAIRAIVFDINNKANIYEKKRINMDGTYVTSRKIGSKLYLISNEYIKNHRLENGVDILPKYTDSSISDESIEFDYNDIRYIPNFREWNFVIIGCLDLNEIYRKADFSAYLGLGHNIYLAKDSLYAAVTNYENLALGKANTENTIIYKFKIYNGKLIYTTSGLAKGRIFNKFSMDEYNNQFRIITTEMNSEKTHSKAGKNIYVFDENLSSVGSLEGLIKGEELKSIKFVNEKVFLETVKSGNTLYVIDLSDLTKDDILGFLSMSHTKNYFYPYDENHLIGIGYDTIRVINEDEDEDGNEINSVIVENGIKISIYNIEDINNIKEILVTKIGDRGTCSEVLSNDKSLLFIKDKNLLVLPVTVAEVENDNMKYDIEQYGKVTFQGAYVYNLNLQEIKLKGKITHFKNSELHPENFCMNYDKNIQRTLLIEDVLYTISNDMINANNINSLEEVNYLKPGDYLVMKEYNEFIASNNKLTEDELNKIQLNGEYIVELNENIMSGHKWNITISNPEIIGVSSERTFNFNEIDIHGEKVNRIWKFKPLGTGKTKIIFQHYGINDDEKYIDNVVEYEVEIIKDLQEN